MSADQDLIAEAEEFVKYGSDLNPVEADRLIGELCAALSRAAAREKVEWETTLVWDHAHRLDMSEGSRWPDLRSALEQHGHDPTLADQADSLSYNLGVGSPDYRAAPRLMRRRKAGPWEPLPVGGDDAAL